jgi:hypothetical protein
MLTWIACEHEMSATKKYPQMGRKHGRRMRRQEMEEKQEYSRREARRQQRCQGGGGVKTEEEEEEYEAGERGEEDIWIWNNELYLVLCDW